MKPVFDHVILTSWIIFGLYWLVRAFHTKPIAERQSVSSALVHRFPLALSYLLLAFQGFPAPMNRQLTPRAVFALAIGSLICVLGLAITIWARRTLAGNWSSDVTFKKEHELVRTGPYRFVRHPIYTGLLVMAFGTALDIGQFRSWLALPVMATAFWIKLSQEERLMLQHFPEQYPAYRKQVKALIPFIL